MNEKVELDKIITGIAADRTSGAMQLARRASHLFADLPSERYLKVATTLIDAQSCMAPLFRVANDALLALEEDRPYEGMPKEVAVTVKHWKDFESAFIQRYQPNGAGIGALATLSWSSTISGWLEAARKAHAIHVFIGESRPLCEGRFLAGRVAEAGHKVTFVTDALLPSLVSECDVVLLGADAVTADHVVNKAGSYGLACAAKDAGKPLIVATSSLKLLPASLEELGFMIRDDSPDAVWDAAPEDVLVRNPLFERIPQRLISGYLLDEVFVAPESVSELLLAIPKSKLWAGKKPAKA